MDFAKRSNTSSSGWVHAAIFNVMLLLLPFLAANVVASVFAVRDLPATPRPAALAATHENILVQFTRLAARGDERRQRWAALVDAQLRERNMPAARGFLLAAPQMLDERDTAAVLQAAPQTVPFGTADEQLVGAALLFLPNDVRVRYETSSNPTPTTITRSGLDGDAAGTGEDAAAPGEPEPATGTAAPLTSPSVRLASHDDPISFSVLGSREDLVRNSREWLLEEPGDAIGLRLTGIGLMAQAIETPHSIDLTESTSLLKAADRAGRLTPSFRDDLQFALDEALPVGTLRTRLGEALDGVRPTSEQAQAIAESFAQTLRTDRLGTLFDMSLQINEIVDATGPVAALLLLEHVESPSDLRRARLIAEAGGDRAIALETLLADDVLDTADTGVELGREDVLEIMGLAAAAMALFWMVLLGMQRNMRSPIRPLRYH